MHDMNAMVSPHANEERWDALLGKSWRLELLWMALAIAALSSTVPLYDADLPMHLSIGEWIVRGRAVPFVEPFAWTREDAPYYAYSWLPQSLYFIVHAWLGPAGLRLLQALFVVGAAAAMLFMAAAMRWRKSTGLMLAAMNVCMTAFTVPALRPQVILLLTVPLLWGAVTRALDAPAPARWLAAIFLLSALTANSHLFFPITAAPLCMVFVRPGATRRRFAITGLALVSGWFVTPYAGHWLDIARLYFGPNVLMGWPSPIHELMPGFVAMVSPPSFVLVPVLGLALLPWLLAGLPASKAERVVTVGLWIAGVFAFGYAVRLLLAWWLVCVPAVGRVLDHYGASSASQPVRMRFKLPIYLCVLLLLLERVSGDAVDEWQREGTVSTRQLATLAAKPAEALAAWMESNTDSSAAGRMYTTFNYGSYLTWRLPAFSASLDSRGIFPDSVLRREAYMLWWDTTSVPPVWMQAHVAILPDARRDARALDAAEGWRRVATAIPREGDGPHAGLWVREDWWHAHGRGGREEQPTVVLY